MEGRGAFRVPCYYLGDVESLEASFENRGISPLLAHSHLIRLGVVLGDGYRKARPRKKNVVSFFTMHMLGSLENSVLWENS